MDGYVTRRLWLDRDPQALRDWQALMQAAKLSDQERVDYTIGIYDGHAWQRLGPWMARFSSAWWFAPPISQRTC